MMADSPIPACRDGRVHNHCGVRSDRCGDRNISPGHHRRRSQRHRGQLATGLSSSGGSGLKAAAANGNTLAQINNLVETLTIGNPLAQAASIDVRIRRIDLPADWTVAVSPARVNLAPGEQTTVTVTVAPGAPAPQNSVPRVAVEGYRDNQLLGGVAIDVVIPSYAPFARNHQYLPLVGR